MAFNAGKVIIAQRAHFRCQYNFGARKQPPGQIIAAAMMNKAVFGDGGQKLFKFAQIGRTGYFAAIGFAKDKIAEPQLIHEK